MRNLLLTLSLCVVPTLLVASPESNVRRVQAHLLIGDPHAAADEAHSALQNFPKDPLIYEWKIRSLAALGEDAQMMEAWEEFHSCFEELALKQDLLEEMCWGILKQGKKASGVTSQLICLIGAALTQDMRAVPFLLEGMRHSNVHIRALAVELGEYYGDHPLREEICRLFREERVLDVRLKVIHALGSLQIEEFLPHLIQYIADPKTGAREKLAAIEAIVAMRDCIDKEELKVLAASKRAGLRQLACEVIATCRLEEVSNLSLLTPLMRDPQPEVCAAALKTWGILRQKVTNEIKTLACEALDPLVGITAAWVWLLDEGVEGEQAMIRWLENDQPHVRALAASAVASLGPYGTNLAKKYMQADDPYVRANLCVALARQREECDQVCEALESVLQTSHDQWMLKENGLFQTLEKSNLSHNPTIPNYPEVVNQTVRLELLNLLAILESPGALESIKEFLKERTWGVTGLAAETLLGEGDETAIELVRELLQDTDQDIRLEAALLLATWGRDHTAVPILLEFYPKADRQMQLKILESLGRIGDKKAIPFLIERLKEPSLVVRMIAASVLIQTLNH